MKSKYHMKSEGQPEERELLASKRPNGSINTHPQERMQAAGKYNDEKKLGENNHG